MVNLTATRCCVIGIIITHCIVILAIVLALVVSQDLYADVVVQDMPGDVRLIHLGRSTAFCEELKVYADPEQNDNEEYQTLSVFDAWTIHPDHVSTLRYTHAQRTLEGQNRLIGDARDYYSFHWMENSTIEIKVKIVVGNEEEEEEDEKGEGVMNERVSAKKKVVGDEDKDEKKVETESASSSTITNGSSANSLSATNRSSRSISSVSTTSQPSSSSTTPTEYRVYFLQGTKAWQQMKKYLRSAANATAPACVRSDACLQSDVITETDEVITLHVNTTEDYYMVFWTNATGAKEGVEDDEIGTKRMEDQNGEHMENKEADDEVSAVDRKAVIMQTNDLDAANLNPRAPYADSTSALTVPSKSPSVTYLGTMGYVINMTLTVIDTSDPNLMSAGTKQSEVSDRHVGNYFLVDFNPLYRASPAPHALSDPRLQDFSNLIVTVSCKARLITYIAVFGLVAFASILFVVIVTMMIINKKFSEDGMVNAGDYTRIVT